MDLVISNANIVTMDPARPRAAAMAVRDGRIVAVGQPEEVAGPAGAPRRMLDLGGRTVLPGFIEGHMHVVTHGLVLTGEAGLASAATFAELRLGTRKTVTEWPLNDSGLTNNIAECGSYAVRDTFLRHAVPGEDLLAGCEAVSNLLVSFGVTSIHDAGIASIGPAVREVESLLTAVRQGAFKPRVYLGLKETAVASYAGLGLETRTGVGNDRLRVGFLKLFADGTMTGRSAALFERYADWPTSGYLLKSPSALKRVITGAYQSGLEVAVHALGDRAIYHTLEAMEEAAAAVPGEHRPRLEHCRLTSPMLSRWARDLGVLMVPQPASIRFLGQRDTDRVGPTRSKWLHPYATWLSLGIRVVGSSDAPVYFPKVESNPFLGIKAAVTRETEEPGRLLAPEEAVTLEQALRLYTRDAAYAAYEEGIKGALEVGKLADFVVLNQDPFTVPPASLDRIQVDLTFIGGEKVFERDPASSPRLPEGKAYFREVERLFN